MVKEEAVIGFTSGAVYGLTSLVVGHPLDTLKTKMQAQSIHLQGSTLKVFVNTIKNDGVIGLYRGCIPPLLGASVLRSVQFGVFETVFSILSGDWFPKFTILTIPNTVYVAGMASGFARALVECPLEIRRQIGESWKFSGLFKGLGVNVARNVPLLSTFFVFLEISKRIDIPSTWRPFLSGSICSTLAWTIVFPLDVMKSQVQGSDAKDPFLKRVQIHYNKFGLRGFFRGYGPACTRSIIANGLSMVMVEIYFIKKHSNEQVSKNKDYLGKSI